MIRISGKGAIKINGRYVFYSEDVPVNISEQEAKAIGKPYEVIKAVVTHTETRKEPEHIGAGYYLLSNGKKVRGKEKAYKLENELT